MTLTFIHDLDVVHVHYHTKFGDPTLNGSIAKNFFLVIFFLVTYYLVTFGIATDRQTDRRTDGQTEVDA